MLDQTSYSPPTLITAPPAGEERERVDLLGVRVDRLTLADALRRIHGFVVDGRPRRVVSVNLDSLRIARRCDAFAGAVNSADLALADGRPLVWASRRRGTPLPERISGSDLVQGVAALAAGNRFSVFLLGAAPNAALQAALNLGRTYPGLRIAGVYSPPFGPFFPDEEERIARMVRRAAPDILLVALGAPRQDLWIQQHFISLGVPAAIGVGRAFDLIGGGLGRAPRWMRRSGLEWLHRLGRRPGRLRPRHQVHDLPLLFRLATSRRRWA
jgi:N-acetylglucosaminyldiphosphoundecaprenol N-acetyl-beta-D-mannosaminyltransferase